MAHSRQAKKRVKQTLRQTQVNRARISRIRTFVKRVDVAVASGDAAEAREALRAAEPEIMRGVSKGVLKRNAASRRVSRLARRVKALAT